MILGDLERAVLDHLWSHGPSEVRAMHDAVGLPRGISFNTVQSTLERLHRKGLAERTRNGRAHCYRAAIAREEWLVTAVEQVTDQFPAAPPGTVLQAFVDLADRAGEAQLEELERLVRERRRQLRGSRGCS